MSGRPFHMITPYETPRNNLPYINQSISTFATMIGTLVKDKYLLQKVIGKGSFAIVYLATFRDQEYAVKVMERKDNVSLDRELYLLENMNHPNITKLVDSHQSQTHLFLVMELCELDLFDFILECKFNVKKTFFELLDAVIYLHQIGIYHRDLKPENVLIQSVENPVVKLSDFGLSTTSEYSREFGCGSVRYMAPETFAGKSAYHCASNDVWSLTIILINMLTGKNPWVEPSMSDKHYRNHMKLQITDSFKQQFHFSTNFCHILRKVFSGPESRPSCLQLKEMLMKLDSFYEEKNYGLQSPPAEESMLDRYGKEKVERFQEKPMRPDEEMFELELE